MKKSKTLIEQQLKSLQTQAGQTRSISDAEEPQASSSDQGKKLTSQQKQELTVAINALFTLLEDAFPTKFKHAFRTEEDKLRAQRVWMSSLKVFPPRHIVDVARKAIKTTKYFPDLAEIYQLCRAAYSKHGLKEPLQAYYEACNAPRQDLAHSWSHKAVYLAARDTGWQLLRGEEQRYVLPIFEQNYDLWCTRVLDGMDLDAKLGTVLEDLRHEDLRREVDDIARQHLEQRMQEQGIDPAAGRQAFIELKKRLSK